MSDTAIDADDLAMLADGLAAAMTAAPGPAEADQAIYELGWGDLLGVAPRAGAASAFAALGSTGAATALLDDVVVAALGLEPAAATAVVFPAPTAVAAPGTRTTDGVHVDGVVSGRAATCSRLIVPVTDADGTVTVMAVEGPIIPADDARSIDPGQAYTRLVGEFPATTLATTVDWSEVVVAARLALSHQLVAGARWMLDAARQHAIDRVQFGTAIAGFQAVRHKLAEALVSIEGAQALLDACPTDAAVDPLLAALAKSLAGAAARTTAKHAQQVLAGIGFTTDHQFQLWMKRSLVIDTLFGSAATIPTELGRHLLERGDAPRLIDL